jgi:C-terminal domain 12 of the ABC-three component (ABC-3C) systems
VTVRLTVVTLELLFKRLTVVLLCINQHSDMKYAYENLGDDQFEKLIVFLCHELLGISVQGFSKGIDGGRDAKFVGTAQLHPSTAAPWVGITIIQAKHTNGYNRNFSEPDFYSAKKTATKNILNEEIPRIKRLRTQKQLDHYMLFANRRLAANAETEIVSFISKRTGVPKPSIYLCGLEQLELWLKKFPRVATLAKLDLVDSPLIFSPDDLSEVVQAFARHKDAVKALLDDPPTPRVTFASKNSRNNMTKEFADYQLKRYLKETPQIRRFLAAPENSDLLELYESVVEELQSKIIAKRKDYQTFDDVMNYLIDLLFDRDPVLRQHAHKRLTRAMLFYMYWNCDIGETGDAAANQTFPS